MPSSDYIIRDAYQYEKLFMLFKFFDNKEYGFIAGGVFKDIFLSRDFRDLDWFFTQEFEFSDVLNKINQDPNYLKTYENNNAVGFENNYLKVKEELVKKYFGRPQEILDSFDFSVSKFCLYRENKKLKVMFHKNFFEDLTTRNLRYSSEVKNPVLSLYRVMKYSGYGFSLHKSDFLKLMIRVNQMDSKEIKDLFLENPYDYYFY